MAFFGRDFSNYSFVIALRMAVFERDDLLCCLLDRDVFKKGAREWVDTIGY